MVIRSRLNLRRLRRLRRLAAVLVCGAAALGLVQLGAPQAAVAEEAGMVIHLSYVHGYSNWGPTNVTGTARLWPHEGVALLDIHLLPHLLGGDSYVSWLVNTHSGESARLGAFNTSEAGDGSQDVIFNQAPPQGADALVVTVQHPQDPAGLPGPQRSLAGFFAPLHVAAAPTPVATPVASGGTTHPVRRSSQGHGNQGAPHGTATKGHGTSKPPARRAPAQPPAHHGPASPPARHAVAHPPAHHGPAQRPARHGVTRLPGTGGAAQRPARHGTTPRPVHPAAPATPPHRVVMLPHTGGGPQARLAALAAARHKRRHHQQRPHAGPPAPGPRVGPPPTHGHGKD